MPLCQSRGCGCAVTSSSIVVAGSGEPGDPYALTALGTHVCTSSTRPTGIQGLTIYETDTDRIRIYDGTAWVITGGMMPGASAYKLTSQSISNATTTPITLDTELYDTDGFHAASNGFFTIPAGLAGDYTIHINMDWAGSTTGARLIYSDTTSNGSIPAPVIHPRQSNQTPINYSFNYQSASGSLRLVAGAVVTLACYQDSGAPLNALSGVMSLNMIRHIPALV